MMNDLMELSARCKPGRLNLQAAYGVQQQQLPLLPAASHRKLPTNERVPRIFTLTPVTDRQN